MSKTKPMTAFFDDKITKLDSVADDKRPVFGIDLGTTNSAISVIQSGDHPVAITLEDGKKTMPSCVMWKDGKFIVGEEAYENRHLTNVVYSVKRHMEDVNATVTFRETNTKQLEMTPAEVSAEILKGLVEKTGGMYGEIKDVVVSVPAYFDQNGRNATKEACNLAGLNLIDMINEPTAAALCYDLKVDDVQDVIVFDLGGGTFDVTLARVTNTSSDDSEDDIYGFDESSSDAKLVQCLAVLGDPHLGGDDIDHELYNILCDKIKEQGFSSTKFLPSDREEIILRLERRKKEGTNSTYNLHIDATTEDGVKVETVVSITPEDFRAALLPYYKRCKKIVDQVLTSVPNNANMMLLVGGSTKHQMLIEMLEHDYPQFQLNPGVGQDLAVSLGASIKGKISKFGDDAVQIFDVLPITIGIRTGDTLSQLLTAGTTLPATQTIPFTTVVDNQTSMTVEVLQGNTSNPDDCVSLGMLTLQDIPKKPAGEPNLFVTLTVNANSLLTCSAKIDGRVEQLELDLTGDQNTIKDYSREEKLIRRWTKVAESMEGEDKDTLLALIKEYPDISSRKDIMSFIRSHTEVLRTE